MVNAWRGVLGSIALVCACTNEAAPVAAKGEPAAAPTKPVEVPAGSSTASPTAPPTMGAGEDWLVWWFAGDAWTTRWLRVDGDAVTVVGERRALIVGDAARMWQLERADKLVRVTSCECMDEGGEVSDKCPPTGKINSLGMRARELGGTGVVEVQKADTESVTADEVSYHLAIVGGVQGTLMVLSSNEGYFCGAHGMYGSSLQLFDLAAGKAREEPFKPWWRGLPEKLRRDAAVAIQPGVEECDEAKVTVEAILGERMELEDVALKLEAGAPAIQWGFSAFVPYVCSAEYEVVAGGTTGLIPEAAPIGLAGPLPGGVNATLKAIGKADALGFSRLTLADKREAMLAAFAAAPETAWPAGDSEIVAAPAANPAKDKLDEGRKLSRGKQYSEAITAFDAALKIDDTLAAGYSGRGYARLLAGDLIKAKVDFTEALKRDEKPEFQAAVWFNLGLLAERSGDVAAARAAYTKSDALRPTKQAKAALTALGAGNK